MAILAVMTIGAQNASRLESPDAIAGLQPGSRLVLFLRGNAEAGSVWGTDLYSGDSNISAAVVHAGILQDGQAGSVTIEIVAGAASYVATKRNGVTSKNSGAYPTAFRFASPTVVVTPPPPAPVPPAPPVKIFAFTDPSALQRLVDKKPGTKIHVTLTGAREGTVYGSGIYTYESTLAAAAVHAGILQAGQRGTIQVTIQAGQALYQGSSRNGVNSQAFGNNALSYTLDGIPAGSPVAEVLPDPGSVATFPGADVGKSYVFWVTGKKDGGAIWGSDVYTSDSLLAMAAVHTGILADGASGPVAVKVLPGQSSYAGTTRNGITSIAYTAWGLSYSLERAK